MGVDRFVLTTDPLQGLVTVAWQLLPLCGTAAMGDEMGWGDPRGRWTLLTIWS
jgi:hypothetical protein